MFLQRVIAFFTALMSIISAFFGIDVPLGERTDDFRVTTYAVADYIQDKSSLHSEDFDVITNVILFGTAVFDRNGNVSVNKESLDTALKNLRDVIADREITVTINILGPQEYGGYTDYYDQMDYQASLHSEAFSSGILEDNIVKLITEYDLDGVHFDYEYPISKAAWKDFNSFLVSLKSKMPEGKILGVAVSDWDMGLDTKAMESVDHIELMLYDNYDGEGRHSPVNVCTDTARKTALKGLPMEKVDFGLPFYARPTDHGAYWYSYNGYYDKLDGNGFFYDEAIDKSFWFNTPEKIAEKTEFARENGFGGVMIWHYTCDLPVTHPDSLLRAIYEAI